MADETKTSGGETGQAAQAAQAQAPQFTVDASALTSIYTNWYRVTGTPEELVIDFGLNPQMGQMPTEPIKLNTRLVMNFYTAKRLLNALQFAVQLPIVFRIAPDLKFAIDTASKHVKTVIRNFVPVFISRRMVASLSSIFSWSSPSPRS